MAEATDSDDTNTWGKEEEDQIDGGDPEAWGREHYANSIPGDYSQFREVLEKYSGIPPNEVEAEIIKIRNKAWDIVKYPCIGDFNYARDADFDDDATTRLAIERLRAPGSEETYLELGAFIGQTIRRLAFAGVEPRRLYATDLHPEFIELGYEQFRDRAGAVGTDATFVAGDLLLSPDAAYAAGAVATALDGRVSIARASNFFHLFGRAAQLVLCERIARFFRPADGASSAMLFGVHRGSVRPGNARLGAATIYLHDRDSFQALWDEVGARTGTAWDVAMRAVGPIPPKPNRFGEHEREMRFTVTRRETPSS
ncbi:putative porphobilinogen deaminase protein [Rosellinia necatrix]|uniref:Putative porphobilinogen deaminase protein n=1 Tax=Rosellinia necatrix TaxID=77044 RepID=A0A1W2TFR5_ROSNE|nr:putative porphobilinogen deaminase protein [Rosellinia necatrix]